MQMSLDPQEPQDRPRLLLRLGIVCVQELAKVEGIPVDTDPDPDTPSQVTVEDFGAACADLAAVNYAMARSIEVAYPHFRGWQADYEALAYELAALIDAVPAPATSPGHAAPGGQSAAGRWFGAAGPAVARRGRTSVARISTAAAPASIMSG